MKIGLLFIATALSLAAKTVPVDSVHVRSMGRVQWNSEGASYDWCGTRFDFSFRGTSLALRLSDRGNHYDITIDGTPLSTLKTGMGDSTYTIAETLPDGVHSVTIERRTEDTWGITTFKEIILTESGELLPAPAKSSLRLLTLGDSFTAGYGIEHPSREGTDADYVNTSNTAKAIGSLVGKKYDADYTTLGYSGKGLIRNASADSPGKEFPAYYDRLFASDVNLNLKINRPWDYKQFVPQIAIVHLGINDFAGDHVSPADTTAWVERYVQFIAQLDKEFSHPAIIVCATGVWPNDFLKSNAKKVVDRAKANGSRAYYYAYTVGNSALHWHPSVSEQKTVADGLIALIEKEKLWEPVTIATATKPISKLTLSFSRSTSGIAIASSENLAAELTIHAINGKVVHTQPLLLTRGNTAVAVDHLSSQPVIVSIQANNLTFSEKVILVN